MDEKIEEMAEVMYGVEAFELETLAEALYNAGYRKIPENAVVLNAEQFSDYLTLKDSHKNAVERCEKLQADNERLYKSIGKFKDIVRKETAEKFERLANERIAKEQGERDGYDTYRIDNKAKYDGDIVSFVLFEICKEITEGNK